MLIEGGYLHSLKKLLDNAEGPVREAGKPSLKPPLPHAIAPPMSPGTTSRVTRSLRALGTRLFRRSMN